MSRPLNMGSLTLPSILLHVKELWVKESGPWYRDSTSFNKGYLKHVAVCCLILKQQLINSWPSTSPNLSNTIERLAFSFKCRISSLDCIQRRKWFNICSLQMSIRINMIHKVNSFFNNSRTKIKTKHTKVLLSRYYTMHTVIFLISTKDARFKNKN